MSNVQSMRLKRWQAASLIGLQLLFAACATSVLFYRAHGWAPDVINFGWLSYRAFNIYVSLPIIGYLVWGLLRDYRHVLLLLAAFSLFHLVEGALIAFWTKAVIHLVTLLILAWMVYEKGPVFVVIQHGAIMCRYRAAECTLNTRNGKGLLMSLVPTSLPLFATSNALFDVPAALVVTHAEPLAAMADPVLHRQDGRIDE